MYECVCTYVCQDVLIMTFHIGWNIQFARVSCVMTKDKTGSSLGKHNADMKYQINNIIINMNNKKIS